jgi:hypothetical protein
MARLGSHFFILGTVVWRAWSVRYIHLNVPALQRTDMRLDAFLCACLLAILVHRKGRVYRIICDPQFHLGIMAMLGTFYAIALVHPMQLTKLAVQSALMPLVVVPTVFLPNYPLTRTTGIAPVTMDREDLLRALSVAANAVSLECAKSYYGSKTVSIEDSRSSSHNSSELLPDRNSPD